MDVLFAILTFVIVIAVWVAAGFRGLYNSGGGGLNDVWSRPPSYDNNYVPQSTRKAHRRNALQNAQSFLKPYKDIMGEICITNENCKVDIIVDKSGDKKIICINKRINREHKREMFTAKINLDYLQYYTQPKDYVVDYIFDTICTNFNSSTVYENIISAVSTGMLTVNETLLELPNQNNTRTNKSVSNLLNLNTATEAELLALPGVNVILAKKALKYIEKHGGFNSVDEFITKMKIKENFADQIKSIVYVNNNRQDINTDNYSKDVNIKKQEPDTPHQGNLDLIDNNDRKPQNNNGNERIIDL